MNIQMSNYRHKLFISNYPVEISLDSLVELVDAHSRRYQIGIGLELQNGEAYRNHSLAEMKELLVTKSFRVTCVNVVLRYRGRKLKATLQFKDTGKSVVGYDVRYLPPDEELAEALCAKIQGFFVNQKKNALIGFIINHPKAVSFLVGSGTYISLALHFRNPLSQPYYFLAGFLSFLAARGIIASWYSRCSLRIGKYSSERIQTHTWARNLLPASVAGIIGFLSFLSGPN